MKLKTVVEQVSTNPNYPTVFQLLVNAKGMPLKTSFKLSQLAKKVQDEFTTYNEMKDNKIKEYGEEIYLDEKGKEIKDKKKQEKIKPAIRVKEENLVKFQKELLEALEQEVKIDMPEITIEDLGEPIINENGKDSELTPVQILSLNWLIKS